MYFKKGIFGLSAIAAVALSGCAGAPKTFTEEGTNLNLKIIVPASMASTPDEIVKLNGLEVYKTFNHTPQAATRTPAKKEIKWSFKSDHFVSNSYICDYVPEKEKDNYLYKYDQNGCKKDIDSGEYVWHFSGKTTGTYQFNIDKKSNVAQLTISPDHFTSTHTVDTFLTYEEDSRPTMNSLIRSIKRGKIPLKLEFNSPYKEESMKAAFERKWGKPQDVLGSFGFSNGYVAKTKSQTTGKYNSTLLKPTFSAYRNGTKIVVDVKVYPETIVDGNTYSFDYAKIIKDVTKQINDAVNE